MKELFIPCEKTYLFNDTYKVTARDGYLEAAWQVVKLGCVSRLNRIQDFFIEGALNDFKEEFMREAGFWCDLAYTKVKKHYGVDYTNVSSWISREEDDLILRGGLWREILENAPFLQTILSRLIFCFQKHICEVAESVYNHRHEIERTILKHTFNRVASVGYGISDYHHDFRSVHIITTEKGERFVYKPRNLGIDSVWRKFLTQIDRYMDISLYAPKVLNYGGYGFVEYIEALPVQDVGEAAEFFERGGVFAGLLYLLNGTDFHAENVIACGVNPILIDLETVTDEIPVRLSLFHSGMFPYLQRANAYMRSYDALTQTVNHSQNLPILNGLLQNGRNYIHHIKSGFERCYMNFLSLRDNSEFCRMLEQAFDGCEVREVKKSTSYYFNVRRFIRKHLQSNESFFEAINSIDDLNEQEREALAKLQIPKFNKRVDGVVIRKRLELLSEQDLRTQLDRMDVILSPKTARCPGHPFRHESNIGYNSGEVTGYLSDRMNVWLPKLVGFFERKTSLPCLAVERNDLHYYFTSGNLFYFESIPSLILSVACYNAIYPNLPCEQIIQTYCEHLLQEIHDNSLESLGLSFPEGLSGLLRSLSMIFEITGFTCVKQVMEPVLKCLINRRLPLFIDTDWLYGNSGVLIALSMLDRHWLNNKQTLEYLDTLVSQWGDEFIPSRLSEAETNNGKLLPDDSYRFGNAGIIDRLIDCHISDKCPKKLNTARILATRVAILARRYGALLGIPCEYPMTSFFYGEGGLIFALCRAVAPDRIPPLYNAKHLNELFHRKV